MADDITSNMDHDDDGCDLSSEEEDAEMPIVVQADGDDTPSDSDEEEMDNTNIHEEIDEDSEGIVKKVYLPSKNLSEDVQLECDETAYILNRQVTTVYPCLSFDVIEDNLGAERADKFPLTMSIVCGTQAHKSCDNNIIVMKMSNLNKNKQRPESDEDEESDSEEEEEDTLPVLTSALVKHSGGVNRIRFSSLGGKPLAASWSESGKVFLWDLTNPLRVVNNDHVATSSTRNIDDVSPLFSFSGHLSEGYAMDWSPLVPGVLATGDSKKNIHLWKLLDGGSWHVEQKALSAHTASVEDIQWSPNENNILASCSVDKSIRIWDTRAPTNKSCILTTEDAHDSDVNVINWNKQELFILSGGDDGKIKVWDIRRFLKGSPLCTFKHHVAPITSVEWHPKDSTVFAASGADDQITLWDLAVEADFEQDGSKGASSEELDVPPQILFIHQGQKEIKEVHWHPQMPGVLISTAQTGFDIFRTLNM